MAARDLSFRPTLLLTRPLPQSLRFAQGFAALFGKDWPVEVSPLSRLEILKTTLPLDGVETLIFTSETGVAAFQQLSERRDLRAWCVGERTAEAARAAGLSVRVGPGDGAGLIRQILSDPPRGTLLHVHGRHLAVDVAQVLTTAGVTARGVTAYDQVALSLSARALDLLHGSRPVLLPLFSPRAALMLTRLQPLPGAPLQVAAISPAVAAAAAPLQPQRIEAAREPNAPEMLDALQRLIAAHADPGPTRA